VNPPAARRTGACPIRTHRGGISEYSTAELVVAIRWIESDTLLRTEDELLAETMQVLGFLRKGSNITGAIKQAIAQARHPGY
jgi:hypothetical protein